MKLAGALVLALCAAAAVARAEPCARAALDGDAAAVASVAAELARLGVATDGAARDPHCRVIVAAVELDRDGGISVAVRDGAQRSEGRTVSDAALAAAWIDSWLRDDFDTPQAEVPAAAPSFAPPTIAVDAFAPVVRASPYDRFAVAVTYEQMWTSDRASWSGFGASGCVRVGALCLGGRAHYASQIEAVGPTAASRSDAALLATASWSRAVGRMSIAPELGLGAGRLATSRVDGCPAVMAPPMCDPTTTMCPMDPAPPACTSPVPGAQFVGDGLSQATYTPRAELALRVAIPLFEHVWLDGLASVAVAPFGHSDAIQPDATMASPLALPGEPLAQLRLGIGLRIGAQ